MALTHEQLAAVITTIPERLRTVLVMSEVLGKSTAQIATELRLSAWRVNWRHKKALVACRARLEAMGIRVGRNPGT